MEKNKTSLLEILKWPLIFLYVVSPVVSVVQFFVFGVFHYALCLNSPDQPPVVFYILYITFFACFIPWLFFALGIFISKGLKEKKIAHNIQIATILAIITISLFLAYVYCIMMENGYVWIVYDLLPLLFWFFLPHVTYLVWHLTRPKKLPWIFTLIGYSAAAVTLHVIAHINLDNVLRFGHS